jgi:hypothetical protein
VNIARIDIRRRTARQEGKSTTISAGIIRTDCHLPEGSAGAADSRVQQLHIWAFLAEITEEFILVLVILRADNAFVETGRHVLRLVREVSLQSSRTRP